MHSTRYISAHGPCLLASLLVFMSLDSVCARPQEKKARAAFSVDELKEIDGWFIDIFCDTNPISRAPTAGDVDLSYLYQPIIPGEFTQRGLQVAAKRSDGAHAWRLLALPKGIHIMYYRPDIEEDKRGDNNFHFKPHRAILVSKAEFMRRRNSYFNEKIKHYGPAEALWLALRMAHFDLP